MKYILITVALFLFLGCATNYRGSSIMSEGVESFYVSQPTYSKQTAYALPEPTKIKLKSTHFSFGNDLVYDSITVIIKTTGSDIVKYCTDKQIRHNTCFSVNSRDWVLKQ